MVDLSAKKIHCKSTAVFCWLAEQLFRMEGGLSRGRVESAREVGGSRGLHRPWFCTRSIVSADLSRSMALHGVRKSSKYFTGPTGTAISVLLSPREEA